MNYSGGIVVDPSEPLTRQRLTFDVLGVEVDAIQIPAAIVRMERWIRSGDRGRMVTLTNVHVVMEARSDPRFMRVLKDADMVCPDGMPLVWIARTQGLPVRCRVYGPDLFWEFCKTTQRKGYRHFFLGGAPGVPEKLADHLKKEYPHILVAGVYSPPFRSLTPDEDAELVLRINAARPDVLWVGLGCPKQERWMHEHRRMLLVPVMAGVGQAFNIYAGNMRQAPRWMREHGLEWLFRLCLEPRRLWRRYIIGNIGFVLALTRQVVVKNIF